MPHPIPKRSSTVVTEVGVSALGIRWSRGERRLPGNDDDGLSSRARRWLPSSCEEGA